MTKIKILLVDDEPDFLKLIGTRIKSWGYDLIKVTNGEEAISAVRDKLPDIVILDYRMPEMDGIATLQRIRELDNETAVIILTAYPDKDALKWSEKLNVSAFVPKLSVESDMAASLKSAIEAVEKIVRANKKL